MTQKNVPADFDLNRTTNAIVTAHLNLGNPGRTFKPEDLDITYVADLPTGQYPADPDRELKVLVKDTDTSYPVYIKSKDLGSHPHLQDLSIVHEGEASTHDLVAKINNAAGAALITGEDVRNVSISGTGYPRSLSIPSSPTGLLWNGNLVVTLTGTETAPEPEPEEVELTAITAAPTSLSLAVGETGTINVTPVPAEAKLTGLVWAADSADVEVQTLPSGGASVKGLVANESVILTGTAGDVVVEVLVEVTAVDAGE